LPDELEHRPLPGRERGPDVRHAQILPPGGQCGPDAPDGTSPAALPFAGITRDDDFSVFADLGLVGAVRVGQPDDPARPQADSRVPGRRRPRPLPCRESWTTASPRLLDAIGATAPRPEPESVREPAPAPRRR
jgi:hypothetical protein